MPTSPYAKILVSVDGAGSVSGGLDVGSGVNIALLPESTVGWRQALWEILDYPEGWTAPAGWSTSDKGTIYSTAFTPAAFDLPDAGAIWGVWMLRLRVNEQVVDDQNVIGNLLDESTCISMLSPSGLRDIGALEEDQFTTTTTRLKKWLRSYQRNLRALEKPAVTLTTTNATPTRIRRYAVADGQVRLIRAIVKVESANGTGAVRGEWEVKVAYGRVSGSLAPEYSAVITEVFKVGSPGAPTFAENGDTDVDLKVTGIAATNLNWSASEFSL